MSAVRPLIKWPGGKARIAPMILSALAIDRARGAYGEPFVGAGSVTLAVRAARPHLHMGVNDVNPRVAGLHLAVQRFPKDVAAALLALPQHGVTATIYQEQRRAFNDPMEDPIVQTARLIWLNRMGFNGLYRESRQGLYNAPWGKMDTYVGPGPVDVERVSASLQGIVILCGDFESVIDVAGPGDRVYCDPPYWPLSETASFVGYSPGGFPLSDQYRLAAACRRAVDRGVRVVISNHDLPEVRALYPGFEVWPIQVKRSIRHDAARSAPEVLLVGGPA